MVWRPNYYAVHPNESRYFHRTYEGATGQVLGTPDRTWLQQVDCLRSAIELCDWGIGGLLKLEEYGWIDLGFRLAQRYWGKGLATEVASAWVRVAFDDLHIARLTALVHPENVASIRVLGKLRFQPVRRATVMGMESIIFSLDANQRT